MDSVINATNIYSSRIALDDFFEEKIDFDISIPDYLAAADKIVKCDVKAVLVSKSIDSERLTLDMQCSARVIYTDDDSGCLRSITKTETFSKNFVLMSKPEVYKVRVETRTISINCRLQNSRRINVKSVIATAVKVIGNCDVGTQDDTYENHIQTTFEKTNANLLVGSGDCTTRVEGNMECSTDIAEIISSDGNASIIDVKVINDKLIVKGEIDVHAVYMAGETPDCLCFSNCVIPFSDVIDVQGALESSLYNINATLTDIRCNITDSKNEISVDAGVLLSAAVYNFTEINILQDIYSTKNEISVSDKKINIESLCENNKFPHSLTDNVQCDLDDARIVGITAKPNIKVVSAQDGMLVIEGEMPVTMYMCNEREYKITDKTIEFSVSRPLPICDGNMRCEADALLKNISYTMPDPHTVTINASLEININCFTSNTYSVIDSYEVLQDKPLNTCKGVILYYAECGEKLWDIAKQYHSSVDIIRRDNSIESDSIASAQMILISQN